MAMKTLVAAKQAVKTEHPRAYASKHSNQMGQHSHWCVWTQLSNGLRLSTGKTEKEAWNNALSTVERQAASTN